MGEVGRYSALANAFGAYHSPIKQFLFSGKGLDLQYQDSTIMAGILERMTKTRHPRAAGP